MMENRDRKSDAAGLIRKLWQYCNVLRDDGLSYPDYVEQLTYLLFLKMSDEQDGGPVPSDYGWRTLTDLDVQEMHQQYARILNALGKRGGMLGLIFHNAKNKVRDPAKLRLLIVDLIGQTEWTGLSADLKGDAYEGLLEKNARDTKSGAGQYFTPRPLIDAIVECVEPRPGEVVCDPACGTAGFLLATYDHIKRSNKKLTRNQKTELATKSIRGVELVEEVARLATMNLLLHGIGGNAENELPVACKDSLIEPPKIQVDVVLTNPPFGVKGSVTYAQGGRHTRNEDALTIVRPDFWVQTANKQLNFLQHVITLLKPGGRAAIVVPDNVLFEGGAAAVIRRHLLESCRVHTLLRLPTGLFYAQGVKSNVLFFDKRNSVKRAITSSDVIWTYDLRSEKRFSLKTKPLQRQDLQEFVTLFRSGFRTSRAKAAKSQARFRSFHTAQVAASTDCRLDLAWDDASLKQRTPGLVRLNELSQLIRGDLQHALALLKVPTAGTGKKHA
jgi:type I restriction enzyme M protein